MHSAADVSSLSRPDYTKGRSITMISIPLIRTRRRFYQTCLSENGNTLQRLIATVLTRINSLCITLVTSPEIRMVLQSYENRNHFFDGFSMIESCGPILLQDGTGVPKQRSWQTIHTPRS